MGGGLSGRAGPGQLSARLGGAGQTRAVIRILIGGALAMLVTFGIGQLVGMAHF